MDPARTATACCILVAGQRRWRVAASDVLDVVPWPKLTAVPLQPNGETPELLGIFEWNNAVVPVFDISGLQSDERHSVVLVHVTLHGVQTPIGLAAADVTTSDEAATGDLLDIPQLVARIPKVRR